MRQTARFAGVLSAVVVAQGAWSAGAQTRSAKVYFSPKGGGHEAVAAAVRTAQKTIDIAMYSISPGAVAMWGPLADAVKRKVQCRVVLHDANGAAAPKGSALENIGCDVRFIAGTMHQKYAIIDGKHLTTGSANWSTGAEQKYSENITVYQSYPGVAAEYQKDFDKLWAQSADFPVAKGQRPKYGKKVAGTGAMPGAVEGIVNLFTTMNSPSSTIVNDALIAAMNGAKKTLDIAVANFNTDAIAAAACAAKARGVTVRALTDQGQFAVGASKIKDIEKCGIPTRYKVYGLAWWHPYSQLMHHKFLIADGTKLATGSYNWSTTAEKSNAENLQIIDAVGNAANRSLVNAFIAEFNSLWDLNRNKLDAVSKAFVEPPAGKCSPIHWDTAYLKLVISMTRSEYQKVRGPAMGAGLADRTKQSMRCVDVVRKVFSPTVPAGEYVTGL